MAGDDFDDEQFTPPPDADEVAAKHQETLNIALKEHEELVQLRLEKATLTARADELESEVGRLRRRRDALAARVIILQREKAALKAENREIKAEVQRLRNERR